MKKLDFKQMNFPDGSVYNEAVAVVVINGKIFHITKEGEKETRVIYNNEFLHNSLPNRIAFDGIDSVEQGDVLAINFLKKFGHLLNTM